jgi:membrane associated rhomboid family serine protease
MSVINQLKYQFKSGGVYIKIIYINIAVYLLFLILSNFFNLMKWDLSNLNNIDDYFTFNSSFIVFLKRHWTIITYMFLHGSFWHLFNNMLIYFFTAKMFEDLLGKKAAVSTYIIGGICGAILYLITHNLFPLFRDMGDIPMLGASAAVMAVFVGLATYTPNFEVMLFGIIRVKLKYLAMIWVAFDIIGLSNSDGVAHFAHLGGAFWGFLYVSNFKKGKDISYWFDNIIKSLGSVFQKRKIKIVYKKKANNPPKKESSSMNSDSKNRQQKVDEILDKIKLSGYESLSKEEKDYLFNASKHI